eukprot:4603897-Amphidinium_carterae.1
MGGSDTPDFDEEEEEEEVVLVDGQPDGEVEADSIHAGGEASMGMSAAEPATTGVATGDSPAEVGAKPVQDSVSFQDKHYHRIAPACSATAGLDVGGRNALFNADRTAENKGHGFDVYDPAIRRRPGMRWVKAVGAWMAKHHADKREGRGARVPANKGHHPVNWSGRWPSWPSTGHTKIVRVPTATCPMRMAPPKPPELADDQPQHEDRGNA